MKIAIFASLSGTNFQAIVESCLAGIIDADVSLLICNSEKAEVLNRARDLEVPFCVLNPKKFTSFEEWDQTVCQALKDSSIELVVLAGFIKKIGPLVLRQYKNKIINSHPSLLPKYGGQGMYGSNVHKSVIENGDSETGITIHVVTEDYDSGPILAQKAIIVNVDDTADRLEERVKHAENKFYAETIGRIVSGDLTLNK